MYSKVVFIFYWPTISSTNFQNAAKYLIVEKWFHTFRLAWVFKVLLLINRFLVRPTCFKIKKVSGKKLISMQDVIWACMLTYEAQTRMQDVIWHDHKIKHDDSISQTHQKDSVWTTYKFNEAKVHEFYT